MADIHSYVDKVLDLVSSAEDSLSKEDYADFLDELSSEIDGLLDQIQTEEPEEEETEEKEEPKEEEKK